MARKEIGAFAYQFDGRRVKVLLVTNRSASRWIMPKGKPERRLSDSEVALMEAYEEGGIVGDLNQTIEPYQVKLNGRRGKINLYIYCVAVEKLLQDWPESAKRRRALLTINTALRRIDRKPLRDCVRTLSEAVVKEAKAESG